VRGVVVQALQKAGNPSAQAFLCRGRKLRECINIGMLLIDGFPVYLA
jgi:hypothetical protein